MDGKTATGYFNAFFFNFQIAGCGSEEGNGKTRSGALPEKRLIAQESLNALDNFAGI